MSPAECRDHSGHGEVMGIGLQEQQQGWDSSGTAPIEERAFVVRNTAGQLGSAVLDLFLPALYTCFLAKQGKLRKDLGICSNKYQ